LNQILENLSEPSLIHAIETNLFELFLFKGHLSRTEIHDDPDLLWSITDVPFPMFNSVMRARIPEERVEITIQTVIDRYKKRNVPIAWSITQSTQPSTLRKDLIKHGFAFVGDDPGMAVDLLKIDGRFQTPAGLRIDQIHDKALLRTWCQTICSGGGLPEFVKDAFINSFNGFQPGPNSPMQFFMGLLKGDPVATSMLFLGAGVAGIYNVVTTPEVRGQGIGTAMTLAPLLEARSNGYRIGVLTSSEMGFRVYRQLGFQEFCKIGNYEWSKTKR
jgi:ribosomal protein S18 acetylase RimI-like enzyme